MGADPIAQPKKATLLGGLLAERRRQKARNSFLAYCEYVYTPYKPSRHHKFMVAKLERIERSEQPRTMISLPPQHGKSLTASILFACWYLGRNSRRRVVDATYGDDRAMDLGRAVLRTLRDARHREIFPECEVDDSAASSNRVDLVAGGGFLAVSRNGALTGRSADLIIIDDVFKDDKEARSAAIRREVIDWYCRVALTRLAPDGSVILVGTRWGCGDLFDYLLTERQEESWDVTNLAALAEANDPLGRSEGEPLWPERYGLEVLTQKRFEVGSAAWTCLYMGQPAAAEGVVWHREWWQYYTVAPEKFVRKIVSLDPAFKTGQQNDFSVMQAWGKTETSFYLLACWRGRVEYPKLKTMLIAFAEQWRPDAVLIEDTASGQSLIQELRATTSLPLRPINPDRDKVARAQACTPQLECGSVYLPQAAPWLNEFLDEVSAFPRAPHDDQLDCASQALNYFREDGGLYVWASAMAAAHAAGDAATEQQKAQLEKFASHGLPSVPYHGPLGPARTREEAEEQFTTLAEAQKAALSGEARGQFTAARNLAKAKAAGKSLQRCPACKASCAGTSEFSHCNLCGWDSRTRAVAQ